MLACSKSGGMSTSAVQPTRRQQCGVRRWAAVVDAGARSMPVCPLCGHEKYSDDETVDIKSALRVCEQHVQPVQAETEDWSRLLGGGGGVGRVGRGDGGGSPWRACRMPDASSSPGREPVRPSGGLCNWNSRSSTVTLLYRGLMRHAVLDYPSKALFGGWQAWQASVSLAQLVYIRTYVSYCMYEVRLYVRRLRHLLPLAHAVLEETISAITIPDRATLAYAPLSQLFDPSRSAQLSCRARGRRQCRFQQEQGA